MIKSRFTITLLIALFLLHPLSVASKSRGKTYEDLAELLKKANDRIEAE